MQACDFQTLAHAKWILAGEHAVLRGKPALVFPIPGKFIKLSYWKTEQNLAVDFDALYGETLLLLFWGIVETALKLTHKQRDKLKGKLHIENHIPMGAGMGFSAAFCVILAKWFEWKGWLSKTELFEFARHLEDGFHGKSSGVDIAGALSEKGIFYRMGSPAKPLHLKWHPSLYLSHSDQISVTAKCIHKVEHLWETNKTYAQQIDQNMQTAVTKAQQALQIDSIQGKPLLAQAINQANHCFKQWGLLSNNLAKHLQQLTQQGATAAKPTGAGDGGYVLSFWEKKPSANFPFELIPAF